jgi:hypothetical protein
MTDPWIKPLCRFMVTTYTATPWYQSPSGTCQVYKGIVQDLVTYGFGATRTWQEWIVDFEALDVPVHNHPEFGPIHLGLWDDMQGALAAMAADLAALGWPSWLMGCHSKGAGQGILAHAAFQSMDHAPLAGRYFEPPMVGTKVLIDHIDKHEHNDQEVVWTQTWNKNGPDVVTRVPQWPEWHQPDVVTHLQVPDPDDVSIKHEWPAVLAAVEALP